VTESQAERLLLRLHEEELVVLVNPATARSLAPGLVQREGLGGAKIAAWLIDQPGVVEVFIDDDALARRIGETASAPPPADAETDFALLDGAWHGEREVDVGLGHELAIEVSFAHAPTATDLARLDRMLALLRGSWSSLLAPALAQYFSLDAVRAGAALESLSLDLRGERASLQLVFDLPGLKTTGFFLDFEGDRVVDGGAAD
jgi:hypothetical protein